MTLDSLIGGSVWSKVAIAVAVVVGAVLLMRFMGARSAVAGEQMSAADAHEKAVKGEIVLIDIRTPAEWQQSGVPASAHAISMNQPGPEFLRRLDAVLGGDRTKAVALICRTGNRSGAIVGPLQQAGFTRVIDVSEGVAGGRTGSGWARAGLPLRAWSPGKDKPTLTAKGG